MQITQKKTFNSLIFTFFYVNKMYFGIRLLKTSHLYGVLRRICRLMINGKSMVFTAFCASTAPLLASGLHCIWCTHFLCSGNHQQ